MTKQKLVTIIFILILAVVSLSGCTTNKPDLSKSESSNLLYAMVRMPDGSIVKGLCSYKQFGYCSAIVVIDGVKYQTGAENVAIWE